MRIAAPLNRSPLEAIAALFLFWLEGIAVFLAALIGERHKLGPGARRWLRFIERHLKALVFLRAFNRLQLPRQRHVPSHPRGAPAGFALVRARGSALNLVTRNVLPKLHTGGARERILRILHVLAHLDGFAARLTKRLYRGFISVRLILTAPPAMVLCGQAPAAAIIAADTS